MLLRMRSENFTSSCHPHKGNRRATALLRGTLVATSSDGGNQRAMTMLRMAIGLIWLLSLVLGRGGWQPTVASPAATSSAEITAQSVQPTGTVIGGSLVEGTDSAASEDPEDPKVDLFGNEVEEAIADYRIDVRGSVYERHSPETAVQKLGSPTT
jgi:hypothetical protein